MIVGNYLEARVHNLSVSDEVLRWNLKVRIGMATGRVWGGLTKNPTRLKNCRVENDTCTRTQRVSGARGFWQKSKIFTEIH
jgi:hypothetical protein